MHKTFSFPLLYAFYDTAMRAGLGPTREGRFLLPGDDRRPADILLPHWDAGHDGALDVTVIHPFKAATVAQAALEPGHALQFAYDRKVRGAAEDCQRQGIFFSSLCGGVDGWVAHHCREASQKAGQLPGKAHWAVRRGSHLPPLGKAWHSPPERKRCYFGEPCAHLP